MALIFIDSFDHYNSSQILRKWTGEGIGTSLVPGRTGNGISVAATRNPTLTFGQTYQTLTIGEAYQTAGCADGIFAFTNVQSGVFAELSHVGDGRLQIDSNGGQDPATDGVYRAVSPPSTFVMSINTWYYIEFKATISATPFPDPITPSRIRTLVTIDYSAYVNGALILSGTFAYLWGIDGVQGFSWAEFILGGPGGGLSAIADDLYVTDGEFLGDVRIYPLFPRQDGSLTQWVPLVSGAHYQMVDEHAPDDDLSYVAAAPSGIGSIDEYFMDSIGAFSGSIRGAQALWCVTKTDSGPAAVQGVFRSGGGTTVLTLAQYYPSFGNYTYFRDAERFSLFVAGTGTNWTVAEVNAMQVGLERVTAADI